MDIESEEFKKLQEQLDKILLTILGMEDRLDELNNSVKNILEARMGRKSIESMIDGIVGLKKEWLKLKGLKELKTIIINKKTFLIILNNFSINQNLKFFIKLIIRNVSLYNHTVWFSFLL